MSNSIKITILGTGAVGKSAITVQLVSGHFLQIYDPTIEDSYRTCINVDGEMYNLDILDTAGQEEYTALRDQYMRNGEGYILVYSIVSTTSFIEANGLREQIYRILDKDTTEHVPIVLVGNKCDLEAERQVNKEEAEHLANEWGIGFIETSAKNKININEVFEMLVRDILKTRKENENVKEENENEVENERRKGSLFKCWMM